MKIVSLLLISSTFFLGVNAKAADDHNIPHHDKKTALIQSVIDTPVF